MKCGRTKEESARYWKAASTKPGFKERRCLQNKIRRARHGAILAEIKNVPCLDCGGRFHHSQMEFDHRPGQVKLLSIGRMKGEPLAKLLAETEKCDIVCANCHALRTWKRANGILECESAPSLVKLDGDMRDVKFEDAGL